MQRGTFKVHSGLKPFGQILLAFNLPALIFSLLTVLCLWLPFYNWDATPFNAWGYATGPGKHLIDGDSPFFDVLLYSVGTMAGANLLGSLLSFWKAFRLLAAYLAFFNLILAFISLYIYLGTGFLASGNISPEFGGYLHGLFLLLAIGFNIAWAWRYGQKLSFVPPDRPDLNPWLLSYIQQHHQKQSRYDIDRYLLEAGYSPGEIEKGWQSYLK